MNFIPPSPLTFSQRLGNWLKSFSFQDEPFAYLEADQEQTVLPQYYIDQSYLSKILGNPEHPQTAFLIAGPGLGKSATRQMVAYFCSLPTQNRQALPVHYTDFHYLLSLVNGDPARLTIHHHLRAILREVLEQVAALIPATYFERLNQFEHRLLTSYFSEFANPLSMMKMNEILHSDPAPIRWQDLTPAETLSPLIEMITHLAPTDPSLKEADALKRRRHSIYILVDRVDEAGLSLQDALIMLKPLVREGPLLNLPGLAFKFFLPASIGDALVENTAVRRDRLIVEHIEWTETNLKDLLNQRVSYFSEGRTARVNDLCDTVIRNTFADRMIEEAGRSPRNVLRLCQMVVNAHLRREVHTPFLDRLDLKQALDDEADLKAAASHSPAPDTSFPAAAAVAAEETPGSIGLYLSPHGHVWIDGEQMVDPLPELEFLLLKTLYDRAQQIISPEDLIRKIWRPSEEANTLDVDEQNLRKLIARLRERLEPQNKGKESRFIKNARGRGYFLTP